LREERKNGGKQEDNMDEPIDNLTTQSTSADEAQTDKSSAIPQGATGEVASNVEAQNAPTDNADTTSTPLVKNAWLDANFPAGGFTPVLDLVRWASDREIEFFRMALFKDAIGQPAPRYPNPPQWPMARCALDATGLVPGIDFANPAALRSIQTGNFSIASSLFYGSMSCFPKRNARFLRIGRWPRGSRIFYRSFLPC
jgi:hypothetical protein